MTILCNSVQYKHKVLTMFVPHITGVPFPAPVMLNWSKKAIKCL